MIISDVSPTIDPPQRPRRHGLPWWGSLLIAICVGLMVACLGAAVTDLQTPVGPVLCRHGAFVAGNTSHPANDGGTAYDIDSACVSTTTGEVKQLNGLAVIGVLWSEYAAVCFIVLTCLVALVRSIRGTRRSIPIT